MEQQHEASSSNNGSSFQSLIRNITAITETALSKPGMDNYMKHCSGIVILTMREYSFGISRQVGEGLLLQRFKDTNEWSLPVAIQLSGAGIGLQIGNQNKTMVIFLTDNQLKAFSKDSVVRLDSQVGFTVEQGLEQDMCTYLHVKDWQHVDGYAAYSDVHGWKKFALSFEGNSISPNQKVNTEMYGDLWESPSVAMSATEMIFAGSIKTDVTPQSNLDIKALHETLNRSFTK